MITALNVDKLRLDTGEYVLSVQSLRKRIGRRNVLDGVDLDVKRGAFTALVGPPGAGKSVTLACISGAVRPSRGRVRYFGYEIRGRGEERVVRMGIARTHQTAQIFSGMTVLETAMVGALLRRPRPARAREHAREMLEITGLTPSSSLRADRLDVFSLRRLELARVLGTDPQLLLLDDVWAGLDATSAASVTAILRAICARGTTMVAATRPFTQVASWVDTVVEIQSGKTVGTGANATVELRAQQSLPSV